MANMQYIADNLVEDGTVLNGLVHIDNYNTFTAAQDCCFTSDGYVVVAAGDDGVQTYSQSNGVLTAIDNDDLGGSARGCCVTSDGYIVIANSARGVDTYSHVAGVLTPVDNDNTSIDAQGCCVTSGGYIVIADHANGVDTYSHIAGVLTHVDNEATSLDAQDCCVTSPGDYIVIADGTNGVDTYSHVAGVLTHVDNEATSTSAQDCCMTSGDLIVIADGANCVDTYSHVAGVMTHIDDNNPGSFVGLGCCVTSDGYILIAAGIDGFAAFSHVAGVLTYIGNTDQGGTARACTLISDGYIVVSNLTRFVDVYRFDYVSSTDTYQLSNLYNKRPGKPFIISDTTYVVIIDFGVATALTSIAIIGHNIDSGATVTLDGNATLIWDSPSKTETISHATTNMYKIFTTGSYRYWRLSVIGASANIKIGEYILGVVATLTNNYQWGSEKVKRYKNITQTTEYGQPWSNYLFNQRSYSLTFAVNDTTVTELETLHEDVQGGNKPFTVINWDSEAVYVRMEDELNFKRTYTNYNESKIELLEMPLGKDI